MGDKRFQWYSEWSRCYVKEGVVQWLQADTAQVASITIVTISTTIMRPRRRKEGPRVWLGVRWCWSQATGPRRWRRSPWSPPGTACSTSGLSEAVIMESFRWYRRWCLQTPGGVEYTGTSEATITTQDVLLEIQGQKVAGYTRADVSAWMSHCSRNSNPVVLKTAPQGKKIFS